MLFVEQKKWRYVKHTPIVNCIIHLSLWTSFIRNRKFFPSFSSTRIQHFSTILVAILERKPCLFFRFLLEGWNVLLLIVDSFFLYLKLVGKNNAFLIITKLIHLKVLFFKNLIVGFYWKDSVKPHQTMMSKNFDYIQLLFFIGILIR